MASGMQAKVVEAFDINDIANNVYEHNFNHHPYPVLSTLTQNLTLFRSPKTEIECGSTCTCV